MIVEPLRPLPYRVLSVREDTADTATLDLEPVGEAIETPKPGQFTVLYASGVGDVAISVSGTPVNGSPLVQTVRGVGAVGNAIATV